MAKEPDSKESPAQRIIRNFRQLQKQRANLEEGTTYDLDKRTQVRIDQPTHGAGMKHAHTTNGVVKVDGTLSHGNKPFMLSKKEFDFLKKKGFDLKSRLIEGASVGSEEHYIVEHLPIEAKNLLALLRAGKAR